MAGTNLYSHRAHQGQKKKKKKKKIQNSVLTYRPNMAVCFFVFLFFLAPFGPGGEYIFGHAIRARFKHADCYQLACSSLALMAGIRSVLLEALVEITRFGFCHIIMTRFENYKLCFSQRAPHKYVLALFFWLSLAPRWTCQLVPIGRFDLGPTQAEAKKKKRKRKRRKKKKRKKKKTNFLFLLDKGKSWMQDSNPCFSQWAPLEYTELDTILVETTTYFPLNVFLIFCQYVSCIPQRAPYQYIETEGYLVKSPNYFLAHCFFCLSTKIKICITLIECTNVCTGRFVGFHPPTPWSVRGGPFPCLESRQRRVPMMETPAIQVNNLRTGISLCSSWPTLWSLSGGSSPLWELKQRQGPMIEISAIQVEDLHIGRSFWSNLPNVWPVRSGSSSLSSPTQGLKPTIRRLDSVSSNTAFIFVIAPKNKGLVLGKLSEREQNELES